MASNHAVNQKSRARALLVRIVELLKRRSSGAFLAEVDGLRFLAIIPVVFMHMESNLAKSYQSSNPGEYDSSGWFLTLVHTGGHGVLLFFVISGFIIARPFISAFRDKQTHFDYRSYLMRRFIRLEPAYFACLILAFIGQCLFLGASPAELLPHLLAAGVYMHSIIFGEWNVLNGVTWSLEIEFQFYILAPVFATIFLISRPVVRYTTTLLLIALWVLIARYTYDWSNLNLKWSIITYGSYFLTGFFLADLHSAGAFNRKSLIFDLMSVAALAMIFSTTRPFYDTIFYMMLFVGVFCSKYVIHLLRHPAIYLIGGMCYTIYLYHYPLTYFIGRIVPPVMPLGDYSHNVLINFILLTPIIIVASAMLFVAIEKPFMNRQLGDLGRLLIPDRWKGGK